jgi:hypothetical protein
MTYLSSIFENLKQHTIRGNRLFGLTESEKARKYLEKNTGSDETIAKELMSISGIGYNKAAKILENFGKNIHLDELKSWYKDVCGEKKYRTMKEFISNYANLYTEYRQMKRKKFAAAVTAGVMFFYLNVSAREMPTEKNIIIPKSRTMIEATTDAYFKKLVNYQMNDLKAKHSDGRMNLDHFVEDIKPYEHYIRYKAAEIGVPQNVALGVFMVEHGGEKNMGEITPIAAREIGISKKDIENPEKNIEGSLSYLKKLHYKYDDWTLAVTAYNYGETNMDNLIKNYSRRNDRTPVDWSDIHRDQKLRKKINIISRIYAPKVFAKGMLYQDQQIYKN